MEKKLKLDYGQPPKNFWKRYRFQQNKEKGKMAEVAFAISQSGIDKKVIRTGRGHDFKVVHINPLTGKIKKTEYVEVKSSSRAPLSNRQKKEKKKKGGRYKVMRPMFDIS